MMGGMFAGHDQSGKECLIFIDNYVLIIKPFLLPYYHFMMPHSKHFKVKIFLKTTFHILRGFETGTNEKDMGSKFLKKLWCCICGEYYKII